MDNVIITVIGSIITLVLTVNAFLLKMLVSEMTGMRIDLTKVTIQHSNTSTDVTDNKLRLTLLDKENNKIRERLHSLEGASNNVLAYLKSNET